MTKQPRSTPARKPAPTKDSSRTKTPYPSTADAALLSHVHYPLSTEKSLRLMESENTLVFCVKNQATKTMIKHAIENLLECRVEAVRTFHTHLGEKRAYVRFSRDTPAIDIATNLGVM